MRKLIVLVTILIILLAGWSAIWPGLSQRLRFKLPEKISQPADEKVRVVSEESVVTEIVEKVTPSVVTVGIEQRLGSLDPFDPFNFFRGQQRSQREQDIGSGFIVDASGLIVTNKHVVSSTGKYKVITSDGQKFDVARIYRDPSNDIAILKIDPSEKLQPVEMGDSGAIKVGQMVVAIGTPLGEFRGTVTKGIVSGLGRGITTGSPFEGFVEKLDDVIQTDAAINPGNSGGPLVNSSSQVIGVNTAIASGAENIGFAIPINVVRDALANFNQTGGFLRPYLGVAYQMVTRELSVLNEIPEGAYVQEVLEGLAADKAGVKTGDIITKLDGQRVTDSNGGLAKLISERKVGQEITLTVWRDGKELELKTKLGETPAE